MIVRISQTLVAQSQHEEHPCANGGDGHANDFGGDDVFDDVVHHRNLIDRRLANNASRCGLDIAETYAPSSTNSIA